MVRFSGGHDAAMAGTGGVRVWRRLSAQPCWDLLLYVGGGKTKCPRAGPKLMGYGGYTSCAQSFRCPCVRRRTAKGASTMNRQPPLTTYCTVFTLPPSLLLFLLLFLHLAHRCIHETYPQGLSFDGSYDVYWYSANTTRLLFYC
jgi:hypothetical protein